MAVALCYCLVACSATLASEEESTEHAIRSYLAVRFDEFETTEKGRVVYGLAYDAGQELAIVRNEKLKRLMPNTIFYRTNLVTHSYEVPKVPVIVSVSQDDDRRDIRSCVASFYVEPSKKFFAQFWHSVMRSEEDARELVEGIAEMLSKVTHEGSSVKNIDSSWGRKNQHRAKAEIWMDDEHLETVELIQLEVKDGMWEQFVSLKN